MEKALDFLCLERISFLSSLGPFALCDCAAHLDTVARKLTRPLIDRSILKNNSIFIRKGLLNAPHNLVHT